MESFDAQQNLTVTDLDLGRSNPAVFQIDWYRSIHDFLADYFANLLLLHKSIPSIEFIASVVPNRLNRR